MTEETIFQEALARSDADRARFLDQACSGQPQLRAAVEALLAAHQKPDNLLDNPPGKLAATVVSHPAGAESAATGEHTPNAIGSQDANVPLTSTTDYRRDAVAGAVIGGRYTLQEKIGEGGMGEVWVAKQTEPVKRKVALKLIKTGMDSRAVLQRFEQERQALALMDHPNIAKVLDGGMTPTGQPYFVMELVNGLPLSGFCDELKLSLKERLELFVPICQAVQHAHQKGIVHRDLKPANILVTMIDGKPIPKVIDFGVAKATSGKLTEETMSTGFGAVVGTLEYMSPEQASFGGEDIDTRSDIYSLGVILYELLTGLRPIDAKRLRKAALTEMIRIIQEEEPSKPSTRLSTDESLPSLAAVRQIEPRKLTALLRGELDWVVMKCLEKQRNRRYETANALARDVQRYLSDEAVEARPPSAGYRLKKFVKRNKGQVIAGTLLLLTLLTGLIAVAAVQNAANSRLAASLTRETNANTALATANQELVESRAAVLARYELATDAIKTYYTGVSEDFLLKEERFKDLRDRLLQSAGEFYHKLGGLLSKESDLPSRRALAQANFELAELTGLVGRPDDALAAYRQVLATREAMVAESPDDPDLKFDLGRSLTAVAAGLQARGNLEEAETSFRRAEGLLAELPPEVAQAKVTLAECRSSLGKMLRHSGRFAEALSICGLARAELERLVATPDPPLHAQRDLAATIDLIGQFYRDEGNTTAAETEYRTALKIRQKLVDEVPENNRDADMLKVGLAGSFNLLGNLFGQRGQLKEAEAEYGKALAIYQQLVDTNPAVTLHHALLADGYRQIALLNQQKGQFSEAEILFHKALAIRKQMAVDNSAIAHYRESLAKSHLDLGDLLQLTGKPSEAEAEIREAININQRLADDSPEDTYYKFVLANSHVNLGSLLSQNGQPAKAEIEFRQSLSMLKELVEANPEVIDFRTSLAANHDHLGIRLAERGQLEEAATEMRQSLAIRQKLADDNPEITDSQRNLAISHNNLGRLLFLIDSRSTSGEEQWRRGAKVLERLVADNPEVTNYRSELAAAHNNLGALLMLSGQWVEAETELRRGMVLRQKLVADNPVVTDFRSELAESHGTLGGLLLRTGQIQAAENVYRQAIEIYQQLISDEPTVSEHRNSLGASLTNSADAIRLQGRPAEALEGYEQAITLVEQLIGEDPTTTRYRFDLAFKLRRRGLTRNILGDPAGAAEDARRALELLKNLTPSMPGQEFETACCHAQLAGLAGIEGTNVAAEQRDTEAEQAIRLLPLSVDSGLSSVTEFRTEAALDSLREREDFKKMMVELENRQKPPTSANP